MKVLLILSLICVGLVAVKAKLNLKFEWKEMEFDWPSGAEKQAAIESGEYIPENNLPLGLERWNDKLFITVPRWKAGVAASLNYINLNTTEKSPKLIPYPSWEATKVPTEKCDEGCELQDNSTIISPFRVQVDACDRLWVMDTGLVDINGEGNQATPNAIVIFDLKTDQLIRRYTIPKDQLKADTFLPNIIVDSNSSKCSDSYAYLPDIGGYGVIVYSFRNDRSYLVTHNFFHFDPTEGDFNVDGVNIQWTDGVFGMTIVPTKTGDSDYVHFHAFAATKEFKVKKSILHKETHVTSTAAYHDFEFVGNRGQNGQSSAEVYDKKTGVIFYTLPNKDAIGCWNVNKPYNLKTQGLIDKDSTTLIFPNDLKVDPQGTVWVLSDKMPTFLYSEWNATAVNYRVLAGNSRNLIKGTACESKGRMY